MDQQSANQQLLDALIRHQTYLMRFSSYVRNQIVKVLNETEDELAMRIRDKFINGSKLTTPEDWARLQSLLESISKLRSDAWDKATEGWKESAIALSIQEAASFQLILNTTSPVILDTLLPQSSLLKSIVTQRPFEGRILKDWASKMEEDDLVRISNAIQLGMTAGESGVDIARRVVGSAGVMGADGVTEMSRTQVHSVVRTSINFIANNSRTEFLQQNIASGIIVEEMFHATLDSRTTPVCKAYDGQRFKLGEGPIPPLHMACRSLRVAFYNPDKMGQRPYKSSTQKQLLREYSEQNDLGNITKRDNLPYGHKTSFDDFSRKRVREMIGNVPAETTYQTWLETQSVQFQNDTLGVTKALLFRQGGLKLTRFVDRMGDELTLGELAARDPSAFIAAGLDPSAY